MRHLKIKTLPKTWYDRDGVMLHACFQILIDFIDKEYKHSIGPWEKSIHNELMDLYHWWKNRTDDDDEVDDAMLLRLMKVRKYLWV